MKGLQGPITRDTPFRLGWQREPENDRLIQEKHPGWQTWRTPENVVMGLPPDCKQIGLQDHHGPRGVTVVCIEPRGVFSVWLKGKRTGAVKTPPKPRKRSPVRLKRLAPSQVAPQA